MPFLIQNSKDDDVTSIASSKSESDSEKIDLEDEGDLEDGGIEEEVVNEREENVVRSKRKLDFYEL